MRRRRSHVRAIAILAFLFVLAGAAVAAPGQGANESPPIIVRNVSELEAALVPANAGRRIIVRSGTYLVSSTLVVPEGASIVGEGVMLGDDLPTGFAPGTETTIRPATAFRGDVLSLGNNSSLAALAVEDIAGRTGNLIGVHSQMSSDTILASISECELDTPNPAGADPLLGPTGRGVAVFTDNPNLSAAPPPHDGARLSVTIRRSLLQATPGGNALFAINFASNTEISLDLRENVFRSNLPLDANGGVSRPDPVSFASISISSRGNSYVSTGPPAWRLSGASSPALPLPSGAATSNRLTVDSSEDRIESPSGGILAIGARRNRTIDGLLSNNAVDLHIRSLTLRTLSSQASDLTLAAAQSMGEFSPGDYNTLTLDMRDTSGSGERLNVYANTLGPLLPENFGIGNEVRVVGTPEGFAERNPGIIPAPAAAFFVG